MGTRTLHLENETTTQSKIGNYALWAIQILGAAMFLMAGGNKLSGNEQMVGMFNAIGVGQWFRYVTGGIEVIAALMLFVPRLAGIGALLLVGTMAGAIATHLFIIGGNFAMPAVLLVLMGIVAYARRERTFALMNRK
jgi:putative oxidoreductase